jgi:NAD(P)-dependent dehydrogenase (short-subunit alcohol dehydrogenase family)
MASIASVRSLPWRYTHVRAPAVPRAGRTAIVQLAGRVGLVTGAATGIGRATALELARAGAAGLAINYRARRNEAEQVAEDVRALGAEPVCVQADLRSDAQVRQMVQQVAERFGRLDVLVNNAGITHWVPLPDLDGLTDEIWDDILDVNLKGAFRCTRAAAPLLTAVEGAVVNVSSISGVLAVNTISSLAYGVAKAGLIYLTRGLAVALAPRVRVNAIAPALTETRWVTDRWDADALARSAASFPLRRIARTEEMAASILALITGGDFVTGQTLLVDGGVSLS